VGLIAVKRPLYLLFALVFVLGCSGGSSEPLREAVGSSPTLEATAPPAPAAPTATPAPPPVPDGERILEHVRRLAEEIGARPAGTEREQAAIDYISAQLQAFGYEVVVQEFGIGSQVSRESALAVRGAGVSPRTVPTVPFEFSGSAKVQAPLVPAGKGTPAEFPADARGAVALIERGGLLFRDIVANATAAGATGAIIFNNEQGTFFGTLQREASIPVVSVSQREGESLRDILSNGPLEAELKVNTISASTARNVIARPPGGSCETVSGGHYDSVPQAPGASDNASGTAAVIEIAGIIARSGNMGGNCFVLFGAEELGLIGSKAYVSSLSAPDRGRIKAMLNFDMVGVGDTGWLLIGSADLQQRASRIAGSLGIAGARAGQLPSNTSSDHASFLSAGIPSLMVHRTDDPLLHTPQDVFDRVRPELLEEAARLGVALLESLSNG